MSLKCSLTLLCTYVALEQVQYILLIQAIMFFAVQWQITALSFETKVCCNVINHYNQKIC